MNADSYLYKEVVGVTHEYLGPAADRFISRQIRNHLQKDPEELTHKDLVGLIDWLKITMAFLTSDEALVLQYVHDLQGLSSGHKKSTSGGQHKNAPAH